MLPCEKLSCPAESRSYLIKDEQDAVPAAKGGRLPEVFRIIEPHPAGTLHNGLQNQGRNAFMMKFKHFLQRKDVILMPLPSEAAARRRHKVSCGKGRAEYPVHPRLGVTYRHGIPCVAVIAGADGHEIRLFRPACRIMILDGHLHGHLNGHRAAVRIEYTGEFFGKNPAESLSELNCRLMREAAEHHMRHFIHLLLQRGIQHRMVVAVHRTPPGRHAVNEFSTVFQHYAASVRLPDPVRRKRMSRRCIWMPQVLPVEVIRKFSKIFFFHCCFSNIAISVIIDMYFKI